MHKSFPLKRCMTKKYLLQLIASKTPAFTIIFVLCLLLGERFDQNSASGVGEVARTKQFHHKDVLNKIKDNVIFAQFISQAKFYMFSVKIKGVTGQHLFSHSSSP